MEKYKVNKAFRSIFNPQIFIVGTLFCLLAFPNKSFGASAIAFDNSNGGFAYASNYPTIEEAKARALGFMGGRGQIVYASEETGYWAVSISKPLLLEIKVPM